MVGGLRKDAALLYSFNEGSAYRRSRAFSMRFWRFIHIEFNQVCSNLNETDVQMRVPLLFQYKFDSCITSSSHPNIIQARRLVYLFNCCWVWPLSRVISPVVYKSVSIRSYSGNYWLLTLYLLFFISSNGANNGVLFSTKTVGSAFGVAFSLCSFVLSLP